MDIMIIGQIKLHDRRQSRSPGQGVRMEKPVGRVPELLAIASSGTSFYLQKGVWPPPPLPASHFIGVGHVAAVELVDP